MTQLRRLSAAVLVAVLIGAPPTAAQRSSAELTMRAAVEKETVEGDVKAAVAMYERAAKEAGADRALAARALLAAADVYRKMGDRRAEALYERLETEFADQPAVVSRVRGQAGEAHVGAPTTRQLWTGRKVRGDIGTASRDGRFIAYIDWDTTELALHDLQTGDDRLLTDKGTATDDYAETGVISRDGRSVAYSWFNNAAFRYQLRSVPVAGSKATPVVLIDDPEVRYVRPFEWSPDGRSILTKITRVDNTAQIALVAVPGGAVTVLETVDWRGPTQAGFSPDGALIAYDLPVSETSHNRDIFILDVGGAHKATVVEHAAYDVLVGWAPDGRSLLFVSDRGGSRGLWAVPVAEGRAGGKAQLVRPDFNSFSSTVGITESGALLFAHKTSAVQVFTAGIDLSTGKLSSTPVAVKETYVWDQRFPAWSPDGKFLAFNASGGLPFSVAIHSADDGQSRMLVPQLAGGVLPRWSPHGALTFQGVDFKGRQGIFQVDPATGAASAIVTNRDGDGYLHHPSWTADGKWLVYGRNTGDKNRVLLREWASGTERELLPDVLNLFRISPDGRWLAFISRDAATRTGAVSLLNVASGASRRIFEVAEPGRVTNLLEWLPDSLRLLVSKVENGAASGWIVPIEGGAPTRLDPGLPRDALTSDRLRVHPDGKRIAFDAGASSYEVSALENFLPAAR
jgi:Tol biopolymer transport system component